MIPGRKHPPSWKECYWEPFTVLSFQRQLTLARQRQLNAIIGLNLARANFELARGTLLEEFGVRIEDAGTGGPSLPAAPAGDQQSR